MYRTKVRQMMARGRRNDMFERFTDRARRVLLLAQEEAKMLNHNYIGTEHILLGLISTRARVSPRRRWSRRHLAGCRPRAGAGIIGQASSSRPGTSRSRAARQEGARAVVARSASAGPQLHIARSTSCWVSSARARASPPRSSSSSRRPEQCAPAGHPAALRLPGKEPARRQRCRSRGPAGRPCGSAVLDHSAAT